MVRSERGQATVEWTALVLAIAILFAGLAYGVARTDAWRLGEGVLHSIICTVGGDCATEDALERAYGHDVAALVRKYAPNVVYERRSAELPIDFRRCRKLECSNGADRAAAIDRSSAGLPVTAFTRVIDRRRTGGPLYMQYWFYYPESFTGGIGRLLGSFAHDWPGYHPDDWEGYQMRIAPGGATSARATAHGGYGGGWASWTGWYRVSGGSHAGRLASGPADERTTRSADLELVPLERLGRRGLATFAVTPPWGKVVYSDPESGAS